MLAKNSNGVRIPTSSKIVKPNQNLTSKLGTQTRSTTKKPVSGVFNYSVSARGSRKGTDSGSKAKTSLTPPVEISSNKAEIGVQVDEVEIIANECKRTNETSDAPIIRLPSANCIKEIEKYRKLKKDQQLKARLRETRKFEEHDAQKEIHLTNLKEFLDTGAISQKREGGSDIKDGESGKLDKTARDAIEAYDRIKRKEDELLKLLNSI